MPTHLHDVLDVDLLEQMLAGRYVKAQVHPDLALTIYNYTPTTQFKRVWNDVTSQCRGLVVDHDGFVVARPFPKFFNLEEHSHTALPNGEVHVTDKLDGSLGILYPTPTGHAIATRGSFVSEQSVHATALWCKKYEPTFCPNPNWTYLFEIVYPANRIVVDYGDLDDLVLIAAIETGTGRSIELAEAAAGWPGPIVEELPYMSLEDALNAPMRAGKEGVVIHFLEQDLRVKIKHDDYVRLHRLITGVSERRIWEALVAGQDLEPWLEVVPDEFYTFITETSLRLQSEYETLAAEVQQRFEHMVKSLPQGWTRKEFALAVNAMNWDLSRALFLILDGKPFEHLIWSHLRPERHDPLFDQNEDTA
jgi:RNA ligase